MCGRTCFARVLIILRFAQGTPDLAGGGSSSRDFVMSTTRDATVAVDYLPMHLCKRIANTATVHDMYLDNLLSGRSHMPYWCERPAVARQSRGVHPPGLGGPCLHWHCAYPRSRRSSPQGVARLQRVSEVTVLTSVESPWCCEPHDDAASEAASQSSCATTSVPRVQHHRRS